MELHDEAAREIVALRALASAVAHTDIGLSKRPQQGTDELRHLMTDGLLQLLAVKDANKRLCLGLEAVREQTGDAKQQLEQADTTLQNLLYEKNYYEKEIHSCRAFASAVRDDQVALMPLPEMLASLTDEDKVLREMVEKGNEHEIMKARLKHENKLRKIFVHQLTGLKQTKSVLEAAVTAQRTTLTDLQTQLRTVESTAKPLQLVLGPTAPMRAGASHAANLLPTPLYICYSQLVAAREALNAGCTTTISGNLEEAESYANAQACEAAQGPNAQPTTLEDLYKPHPLNLELRVHKEVTLSATSTKPPTTLLIVLLQYLPALKVVTATCPNLADNHLLKGLFPGDDGSGMPLEALSQLNSGTFRFSSSRQARPFRWCQHLGGLDFVPTLPVLASQLPSDGQEAVLAGLEGYRTQQRVLAVVQRLREAKVGDASLMGQVNALLKSVLPSNMSMFTRKPTTVVAVLEVKAVAAAVAAPSVLAPAAKVQASVISKAQPGAGAAGGEGAGQAAQAQQQVDDGELPQGEPADDAEADAAGGEQVAAEEGEAASGGAGKAEGREAHDEGGMSSAPRRGAAARTGASATLQLLLLEQEQEEAAQREASQSGSAARGARLTGQGRVAPHRSARLVIRSELLELEVMIRLYTEYPVRPPAFQVVALRDLPSPTATAMQAAMAKGMNLSMLKAALALPAGKPLGPSVVNSIIWLEQQVNIKAVSLVPAQSEVETLLYQVTYLRLCLDELTAQHKMQAAIVVAARGGVARGPLDPPSGAGNMDRLGDVACLHARQMLVGRDRQPPAPCMVAGQAL